MSGVTTRRPRIILLTGDPGSGKTTLGVALSRTLQVPFLARDDVRRGMYFTHGAWTDQPGLPPAPDDALETFLLLVEQFAALGVSCIAEYVVRRRDTVLGRLERAGDLVVIRTTAATSLERFAARDTTDRLLNQPAVLGALGHATIEDHVAAARTRMSDIVAKSAREFDARSLVVDTSDGYSPSFEAIVAFAIASD